MSSFFTRLVVIVAVPAVWTAIGCGGGSADMVAPSGSVAGAASPAVPAAAGSSGVDPASAGAPGLANPASPNPGAGLAPASAPSGSAANRPSASGSPAPSMAGESPAASSQGAAASEPTEVTPVEVEVTVIATMHLARPSDLEWNPYVNDELWVMNHGDSSAAVISAASSEARSVQRRLDPEGARHFMPQPTAFAFGARETTLVDAQGKMVEGTFATCPESNTAYMGPSLWTSDLRIFAITKSEREPPFNGADTGGEGPGSHLDMLHRTPTCAGMAWAGAGNVYWTYSGGGSMLVKYDFGADHGIGNTDHSDGSVWRYPLEGVLYVPGVPSHLEFDAGSQLLYMADTGNGRIVSFDPNTATDAQAMSALDNVDGLDEAQDLNGGKLNELVAASYGMLMPSGLALHGGAIYVSDNETGTLHKFALDGKPLAKLLVPGVKRGALAGLAFGPDDKLYFVDMVDERVLRLENAF